MSYTLKDFSLWKTAQVSALTSSISSTYSSWPTSAKNVATSYVSNAVNSLQYTRTLDKPLVKSIVSSVFSYTSFKNNSILNDPTIEATLSIPNIIDQGPFFNEGVDDFRNISYDYKPLPDLDLTYFDFVTAGPASAISVTASSNTSFNTLTSNVVSGWAAEEKAYWSQIPSKIQLNSKSLYIAMNQPEMKPIPIYPQPNILQIMLKDMHLQDMLLNSNDFNNLIVLKSDGSGLYQWGTDNVNGIINNGGSASSNPALSLYNPAGSGSLSITYQAELQKIFRTSNYSSFSSALIAASGSELWVDSTVNVTTSLSISALSNLSIKVLKNGSFNVSSGQTLTINVPFVSGVYKIFNGTGSVSIHPTATIYVYPEWFGAVPDGITESAPAVHKAIASSISGCTVKLSRGTYLFGTLATAYNNNGDTYAILKDGVNIEGEGNTSIVKVANNESATKMWNVFNKIEHTGILKDAVYRNFRIDATGNLVVNGQTPRTHSFIGGRDGGLNVVIENMSMTNCPANNAVVFGGRSGTRGNIIIRNNYCYGMGAGIIGNYNADHTTFYLTGDNNKVHDNYIKSDLRVNGTPLEFHGDKGEAYNNYFENFTQIGWTACTTAEGVTDFTYTSYHDNKYVNCYGALPGFATDSRTMSFGTVEFYNNYVTIGASAGAWAASGGFPFFAVYGAPYSGNVVERLIYRNNTVINEDTYPAPSGTYFCRPLWVKYFDLTSNHIKGFDCAVAAVAAGGELDGTYVNYEVNIKNNIFDEMNKEVYWAASPARIKHLSITQNEIRKSTASAYYAISTINIHDSGLIAFNTIPKTHSLKVRISTSSSDNITVYQPEMLKTYYTSNYSTFTQAVTSAVGGELIVNTAVSINSNTSVSALGAVALKVAHGGSFSVSAGCTLTIDVPFNSIIDTIFTNSGTAVFAPGMVQEVYPQWWGAIANDYTFDQTSAFVKAINSSTGSVRVFVPAGDYRVNLSGSGAGSNAIGKPNLTIEFANQSHSTITNHGTWVGATSTLRPWDITKPIFQTGNDYDYAGVTVIGLRLNSFTTPANTATGSIGLKVTGGSYECRFIRTSITGYFSQYSHLIDYGNTLPTSKIFFDSYDLNMGYNASINPGMIAGLGIISHSSTALSTVAYVSALYFNNFTFNGATSGYTILCKSSGASFSNGYMDMSGGYGIYLTKWSPDHWTSSLELVNTALDFATPGVGIVNDCKYVVGGVTKNANWSEIIRSTNSQLSVNATINDNGTIISGAKFQDTHVYSALTYPTAIGAMYFTNSSSAYGDTTAQISKAATNSLWMTNSSGAIRVSSTSYVSLESSNQVYLSNGTGVVLTEIVSANAVTGSLYVDSTDHKLYFKDSSGVPHALY